VDCSVCWSDLVKFPLLRWGEVLHGVVKGVGRLPMARPEAINHSKIRCDREDVLGTLPVASSLHGRKPSASPRGRREAFLRRVRPGEQGRGLVRTSR
jgi:hypothetical protein